MKRYYYSHLRVVVQTHKNSDFCIYKYFFKNILIAKDTLIPRERHSSKTLESIRTENKVVLDFGLFELIFTIILCELIS